MATKNYAIHEDPQLVALRQTVAALVTKQIDIKAIIARLSITTSEQDFNTAVNAVTNGIDPMTAAAALDNATALLVAENSYRLLEAAIARARTAAAAEERCARDRFVAMVRPEYVATAKKFATALLQLADVQASFYVLEKKLSDAGLGTFPVSEVGPFGLRALGDILDENSITASWLIAAVSHNVIELGSIPSGISDGWRILNGIQKDGTLSVENPQRAKLRGLPAAVSLSSHRVRSLDRSLARAAG